MRLLLAELAKLARPLTWGVTGTAALFCVLLAAGGAHNAVAGAAGPPVRQLPSCPSPGIPAGPPCARAHALERARIAEIEAGPAHVAAQLAPAQAGAEAAGLIASLPGALALALLAGAHLGGEWSGRTLKSLLTQEGRRWRVLAAKLVSTWLAGAYLIAVCWAALAVAGPVIARLNHLPASRAPVASGLSLSLSQGARALLVLAAFSVIALAAAVLTRGTIGTTAAAAGTVIAMLAVASLPGPGQWTPATWVEAWMRFPAGQASITALPTNFWSRFIGTGAAPGQVTGLAGLLGLVTVGTLTAAWVFRRSDVSG